MLGAAWRTAHRGGGAGEWEGKEEVGGGDFDRCLALDFALIYANACCYEIPEKLGPGREFTTQHSASRDSAIIDI